MIVVGSGWASDAKRSTIKFQPKLEPGVHHKIDVSAKSHEATSQARTVVEQPRQDILTAHHRDVSRAEPTKSKTVAPYNVDQSKAVPNVTGAPLTQPPTVSELPQNNEPVVKRRRGRPRKYVPKTTVHQQTTKVTQVATAVPRPENSENDAVRNWLICDKENISPRSAAVVNARRNAGELDRNIWTSNVIRDASLTSKSLQSFGLTTNKVVNVPERHKLTELPVNVILSDDNNNHRKRPAEKTTTNLRLKEFDKDKLMSVWNALKDTLQADDWDAISRKDRIENTTKCELTEPRTASSEVTGDKCHDKVENCATEHQNKRDEVPPAPAIEADRNIPCQRAVMKNVHWKCPEMRDVGPSNNKAAITEAFSDEPVALNFAKTTFPFVDDFDDKLPLSESLGKPLFTSTPIKLTNVATPACSTAAPNKRARVRFRPVTQVDNNDEEDVGDRVELSKLAALPSMQHGVVPSGTQISGVRPADIVRAFRTIDNVAAATSSLPLSSHGVPPTLPFAAIPTVMSHNHVHTTAESSVGKQPTKTSSRATTMTSSSEEASPLPSEIVPEQLLHFYGAQFDGPPYNLSPSTGGFVTKAARKRPIVDDVDFSDRKRFQPDVDASHVAGHVMASASVPKSVVGALPVRPAAVGRPAAEVTSRESVRRAPNGVPVDDLLQLQRKLSTVSDAATLRRVVQIIGETGRYCVNDVTFDFDLCKLDSSTVTRLIHCLDAAAAV